jgi:[acyl-carrier-protein] S-malonyltransferase
MRKRAFVFPGQGAQYVGMGKEFYDEFSAAREVFEESSDYLGYDMKRLCFMGPEEELVKTENTQPAILTASIAMMRVLEQEGFDCQFTAGLSLGEYSALVKAKVLKFSDAVQIVRKRGRFMQEAVPMGVGAMAAILGLDRPELEKCLSISKMAGIVEAANYNSPGQVVISGEVKAVEYAVSKALELGAKKAVVLPVSAPFHCSLLKPAGEQLRLELMNYEISSPAIPVITNAEARILENKESVVPSLVKQVSHSVLWENSVEVMLNNGVEEFIEIGPGKTLTSFIKRIAKGMNMKAELQNVENLETFKALLQVR